MNPIVYEHSSDAIRLPSIIKLEKNLYIARFESMKVVSTLKAVEKLLEVGVLKKAIR